MLRSRIPAGNAHYAGELSEDAGKKKFRIFRGKILLMKKASCGRRNKSSDRSQEACTYYETVRIMKSVYFRNLNNPASRKACLFRPALRGLPR